jgi:hypothetical protein
VAALNCMVPIDAERIMIHCEFFLPVSPFSLVRSTWILGLRPACICNLLMLSRRFDSRLSGWPVLSPGVLPPLTLVVSPGRRTMVFAVWLE